MGPARGLTTAAATWTVAATGVLAGVGFYLTAILATAITLLILEIEFMPLIGGRLHRMAPGVDRAGLRRQIPAAAEHVVEHRGA